MKKTVLDPKELRENGKYNEYGTRFPVPGFRNLPWFAHPRDLPKLMTPRFKAYNAWAESHGEQTVSENEVQDPGYSFVGVMGAGAPLETENLRGGTFTIQPDTHYGVGSHANWEVYIVISGQGEFFNYDRSVKATPGTWVMLRPFDAHGIKNTGSEPLEIIWFWWNENPEVPNWDAGGLPIQPGECWKGKGNKPDVSPATLPEDLQGEDRFIYINKK